MNKKGGFYKSSGLFILSMVVVNLLIILASLRYYRIEKNSFIGQKTNQLEAIAESKVNQIAEWRNERISDARYLSYSPQINENSILLSADPGNRDTREKLYNTLQGMFLNGKYESMVITDSTGYVLLSIPEGDSVVSPYMKYYKASENTRSQEISIGDVFLLEAHNPAMQIVIPLLHNFSSEVRVIGRILLNINLKKDLFPKLETLPVLSETMEVNLVMNDGYKTFALNRLNLVHTKSGSENHDQEYFKAGFEDNWITASLPVPGSKTYVIVKLDRAEVFAEMKKLRRGILAFALLMVFSFSFANSFFWLRHRHELTLLQTEKRIIQERFDMLSKFANDAIIVYTKDMIILQVNDKALELYGYSRAEILGMNVELLRSPETRGEIPATLETTMNEGGCRIETVHIMKDGTCFPVEVSIRFMELMGNPCFQSIVRDITQRKRFEKAIITSEERLRLITNTMPQIVWTATPDGVFDYINSRFELLTGLHALKETNISGFIHGDDQERVISFWQQAVNTSGEQQIRFRLRMKEGNYRWFLCIAIPLCDEKGRIKKWYGSATDIDELENQVAQRTAELSDLYNNAPCGYHSMDIRGYFTQINNTALSWLGYARDELIGVLTFADLLTPDSKKIFTQDNSEFFKSGHIENKEYEMVRRDGSLLPVLLSATSVRDNQGNILMFRTTIIDHTQRKKYENEILKLNVILQEHGYNLEYANKELEAFIFSVSHDLRAPLRAINGFSRILKDEYAGNLDEAGQQLLQRVLTNADRMRQLIDDLLRLSRTGRQHLSYTRIDMQALFSSMVEETRQQFPERNISVEIKPLPAIEADLALIKQVISNLLSNAVKFSGKKEIARIEIGSLNYSDDPSFYIKDNGTGFDMKYVHDLFGVFKRLDNAADFEGTGVGLALVKRIIDKHGGRIWADSEPGKGATFCFAIPKNNEIQI